MSTNKSTQGSKSPSLQSGRKEDSHRAIIKSTSILSVGTLSSRILGFIRDVILAKLLGTGLRADAFFVALKIPNLFRDMVGEGATHAAIVPVFSEYKEKEKKERFWEFASIVLSLGLITLSVITLLGILLAPVLIRVIVPGFMYEAGAEKLLMTVRLTRMMFPYLIMIGLTAYCMGILFTFRSFVVPAFTPCLLNIAIIISALIASRTMAEPVYGLAIGVLIGGLLQLIAQAGPLKKVGMRLKRPTTLKHEGAAKIGRLLIPRLIGSGVYQLTVLIDTFCASLSMIIGAGGISAIYYANRIIHLPMGIFGVALASAVLPSLSDLAARKEMETMKKTIVFSLENIFFVMCPVTVALLILAQPVIRILFERGQFGTYSTNITSLALTFYALGLFSFGGIKILVSAFHALQDTKTPVTVAAFCLVLNAVLNFVLMFPLKIGGIALASSIAGTVDFLVLYYLLEKKLGGLNSGLRKYFIKVTLVSSVTGLLIWTSWINLWAVHEITRLIFVGLEGLVVYQTLCALLQVEQAEKIHAWIFRK